MACSISSLWADAKSNGFTGVEPRVNDALFLQLLCNWAGGVGPATGDHILTEGGDIIATEDGNELIIE